MASPRGYVTQTLNRWPRDASVSGWLPRRLRAAREHAPAEPARAGRSARRRSDLEDEPSARAHPGVNIIATTFEIVATRE